MIGMADAQGQAERRVAWVTGASRGIGRGVEVTALAERYGIDVTS